MDIQAVVELGRALRKNKYHFVTVTPETHRRVLSRPAVGAVDPLRELFGWSRAVPREQVHPQVFLWAERAGVIISEAKMVRSLVRFSTLGRDIFLHSAYPTEQDDAVFFGPDSYRFVSFVQRKVKTAREVLDLGCGSGVGGLSLSREVGHQQLYLSDISSRALQFAQVNAILADVPQARIFNSDLFQKVPAGIDTVIANPPFVVDSRRRLYRHGGDGYGTGLSVEIAKQALSYLSTGGQLALYTGTAVVGGVDIFKQRIDPLLTGLDFTYEEIDPDIFGEELDDPNYQDVERIAAVGLYVTK